MISEDYCCKIHSLQRLSISPIYGEQLSHRSAIHTAGMRRIRNPIAAVSVLLVRTTKG